MASIFFVSFSFSVFLIHISFFVLSTVAKFLAFFIRFIFNIDRNQLICYPQHFHWCAFLSFLTLSVVFEQQGWSGIVLGVSSRSVVVEAATSVVSEHQFLMLVMSFTISPTLWFYHISLLLLGRWWIPVLRKFCLSLLFFRLYKSLISRMTQ